MALSQSAGRTPVNQSLKTAAVEATGIVALNPHLLIPIHGLRDNTTTITMRALYLEEVTTQQWHQQVTIPRHHLMVPMAPLIVPMHTLMDMCRLRDPCTAARAHLGPHGLLSQELIPMGSKMPIICCTSTEF